MHVDQILISRKFIGHQRDVRRNVNGARIRITADGLTVGEDGVVCQIQSLAILRARFDSTSD